MNPLTQDLSVSEKSEFDKQSVGVKVICRKPKDMKKVTEPMAICEMIREAQDNKESFYMAADDEDCFGPVTLGMRQMPPFAEAGMIGEGLGIYKEPRANARLYNFFTQ